MANLMELGNLYIKRKIIHMMDTGILFKVRLDGKKHGKGRLVYH